jgi:4-alpha-glucanotransferase
MELVTLQMPDYAVRYLAKLCEEERQRLAYQEYVNQAPPSLQDLAAFDALEQIEYALP